MELLNWHSLVLPANGSSTMGTGGQQARKPDEVSGVWHHDHDVEVSASNDNFLLFSVQPSCRPTMPKQEINADLLTHSDWFLWTFVPCALQTHNIGLAATGGYPPIVSVDDHGD